MIDIMYSLGTNNEELINRFLFVSTRGACSGGICARAATEERHVGSVERKKWIRVVLSLLSWEVLHRLDEDQSAQRERTGTTMMQRCPRLTLPATLCSPTVTFG